MYYHIVKNTMEILTHQFDIDEINIPWCRFQVFTLYSYSFSNYNKIRKSLHEKLSFVGIVTSNAHKYLI